MEKKQNFYPPIFIVGAPRSGSTLLYQLLAYYYNFSYFTNYSSLFYRDGQQYLVSYLK